MVMNQMEIYNLARSVPQEAMKPITAGRLKGFTDINPMWRIKRLTEMFGPCGIGWWYIIKDKRIETGANGEICAFMDIDLYYKWGDTVSQPIPGTGGSSFVAKEKNGMYTSDECFKMALTDAISVAAKAIGVGADVYYQKDRDKYTGGEAPSAPEGKGSPPASEGKGATGGLKPISNAPTDVKFRCFNCGDELKPYTGADGRQVGIRKHAEGSMAKYGKVLCINCILDMQNMEDGIVE